MPLPGINWRWLLGILFILTSAFTHAKPAAGAANTTPDQAQSTAATAPRIEAGQTATPLPDGRWLIAGGDSDKANGKASNKPGAALQFYDPASGQATRFGATLHQPRAYHSATLLPDGRLFLFGGIDAGGNTLASAELIDLASNRVSLLDQPGMEASSHHSATLLSNGKVLLVGGLSASGKPLAQAESWDPTTGQVSLVERGNRLARSSTVPRLLADGNVLYLDRQADASSKSATALLFDAARERFEDIGIDAANALLQAEDSRPAITLAATAPVAEAGDFLPGGMVSLRFSRPASLATVNNTSITLLGPFGMVESRVTPSQDGMLAFLVPKADLLPATRYSLFIKGVADVAGAPLAFQSIGFNTAQLLPGKSSSGSVTVIASASVGNQAAAAAKAGAGKAPEVLVAQPAAAGDVDDEVFLPGPEHAGARWRTGRPLPQALELRRNALLLKHGPDSYANERKPSRRATPPGQAARSGTPALAGVTGQVLRLNDRPLSNALIQIGSQSTRSDAEGRFQLTGIPAGRHELLVDGATAGGEGRQYARFILGVTVDEQGAAEVPPIYLPRLRASDWIPIASPLQADTVIQHPNVPGMEIHLPRGTVLRDREGKLVTRIALVPVPLDRMPFAFPENAPVYVSVQPAGMVVQGLTPGVTKGIRVIYPNLSHEAPGSPADFWRYDAGNRGWYVYGRGQASADGRQIVPDASVALYDSVGFMYTSTNPIAPPVAPPPPCGAGTCCPRAAQGGDPVDLSTGLFLHEQQHASLKDVLPVSINSTYRPGDPVSRPFGFGTTHYYAMYLREVSGTPGRYQQFDLILSNGAAIRYYRTAGDYYTNVVAQPRDIPPCEFYGSVFAYRNGQYVITRKDGQQFAFSLYGRLEAITDRLGNQVTVSGSTGQIQRIATPNGRYLDFSYDSANRISRILDMAGRAWTYAYEDGMLSSITFPDQSTERYSYDASRRMVSVTDRRGNTMVRNEYDASNRVTRQTLADGSVYAFAYSSDAAGRISSTDVTDPRGLVRRVTFHQSGYPLSDTEAHGTALASTAVYSRPTADGQLAAMTDSAGRRTDYSYDAKGNLTSRTRLASTAQAATERMSYEPTWNQLASHTSPLGQTTTYTYDNLGQLTSITRPLGRITRFTYNSAGQVLSITNPLGKKMQFEYSAGDLVGITDPLGQQTRQFIDLLGRLTSTTDPLGNRQVLEYDAMDRVIAQVDALGSRTQLSYDAAGNLLTVTDALGNATMHGYDTRHRLVRRSNAAGGVQSVEYDGLGNVLRATDAKEQVTSVRHDALNRPVQVEHADGSSVLYGYDSAGRLISVVDRAGSAGSDTGNASGTSADGTGTSTDSTTASSITRSYDSFDRLLSETTPQGQVSYSYDAEGRRSSVQVSGQLPVNYRYDAAGRLTGIAQGNDTVSISYDDASRLTGIVYTKPDGTLLGDLSYRYDAAGRRIGTSGTLSPTSVPEAMPVATYGPGNRLQSWNGQAITHDANGNMTSDGTRSYTWDAKNQLASITGPESMQASFRYDAFGRRVSRTVNGVETGYVYDGINPVQELGAIGASASLLTGLGVDEYYRRTDAAGPRDMLTDALGSVLGLADGAGQVRTTYQYEPYGATTVQGEVSANSFQYTGRENDGTGLYYYRARYYHPGLGRFVAEDPIGLAGGINAYAYVENDPISYTDPFGLAPRGFPQRLTDLPPLEGACSGSGFGGATTSGASRFGGGKFENTPASTPVGKRGSPLEIKDGTNSPTNINDRQYSGHALDRMQGRGVPPSAVEDAIQNGVKAAGNKPGANAYTSGENGIQVIVNDSGRVVTVKTVGR
ncbi:RHS repeat-associated core domain-containing protein [Noviherbaspirillum soli]|uniref:RHS repeat-associated core domain-containing protein n=1 Tax=Noviherbaspirillum soli TaxID=1064518 RepID=UPI00188CB812|nr:RHS repeat-associated core domain-containing protein [Noviherbaspirillum soli]